MVDKRTMHEPTSHPLVVATRAWQKSHRRKCHHRYRTQLARACGRALRVFRETAFVRRGDPSWKAWFYEYNYERQFPYTPNVRGVRTDEWKYIRYPHGDGSRDRHFPELYHLKFDPEERQNLAQNPAYADLRRRLEKQLAALLDDNGLTAETDRMPVDQGIKTELPDQKIR
jgi:N-acetylglucosamine-6-sulfatase